MKNKPSVPLIATLSVAMMLSAGCASSRVENTMPSTQTQVNLNHGNYKVIKAGAEGHSYGFRFLLGIIPIAAPSTAAAREDLYHNVGQPVNGKSVALVNVVEDHSTTWLLLFSVPKIVVTGDVVEFVDANNGQMPPVQTTNSQ
jgi:Family of unknown function (DUF6567)